MRQEDDVWEYWGYCGEIESLDLMRFPDTGRFKGICFITFKTVGSHTYPLTTYANLALSADRIVWLSPFVLLHAHSLARLYS